MKTLLMAVAVAGMLGSGSALADGNKLLEDCQSYIRADASNTELSADEALGIGHCLGLVEGVMKTMIMKNISLPKGLRLCFPENIIGSGQAARIVEKFLRENPSVLHKDGAFLTMIAFDKAFPCK
jgi:hypothetical protein